MKLKLLIEDAWSFPHGFSDCCFHILFLIIADVLYEYVLLGRFFSKYNAHITITYIWVHIDFQKFHK